MSGEQTWPDDVDEVDDEVGTLPLVDLRYERALVGLPCWVQDSQGRRTQLPLLPCWVQDSQGRRTQLPLRRWLGGTAASEADRAVDAAMLRHCTGPTVDLGCGPGRLTAALAVRGVAALGVDTSALAVRMTVARGGLALQRDLFAPLPGHGRWSHVLLADGNIGIGG